MSMKKRTSQRSLLISCINKFSNLSKRYIDLVSRVRKSDTMRGFNTSVTDDQVKALEAIRDRLDGGDNNDSDGGSELFKSVRLTLNEIENDLTQHSTAWSINDIIKYVQDQFYQVYLTNKDELEYPNYNGQREISTLDKFRDTNELEGVKGRLNFQNAKEDLARNYQQIRKNKVFYILLTQ